MASPKREKCRICGKRQDATGKVKLSRTGAHHSCAIRRAEQAAVQMRERHGEHYDKWRKSMVTYGTRIA